MGALSAAFDDCHVARDPNHFLQPPRARKAARTLAQWQKHRITLVSGEAVCPRANKDSASVPLMFAKGDLSFLSVKRLALLNSRCRRRITPSDPWLLATKALFRARMAEANAIVSSIGTPGYDLVNCMAASYDKPLVVVCDDVLPFMKSDEQTARFLTAYQGFFDLERTLLLSPFPPGTIPPFPDRRAERDRLVAAVASTIAAAEVREGGNMETILAQAARSGVPVTIFDPHGVEGHFKGNEALVQHIPVIQTYKPGRKETATRYGSKKVGAPAIPRRRKRILDLRHWATEGYWLTHYTRACPGPWPGQSLFDYYRALLDGDENAGHSAFDTLQRILDEGVIRASNRFTRGRIPVVSFTACLPGELMKLVEWRRGLIRWSFQPYAIAVKRESLIEAGAAPVIYGDETALGSLAHQQAYRFQIQKPGGKDWTTEKEWRIRGDARLERFPREDITIIVPTVEEAWEIREKYDFEVTLAGIDWKGATDT